MHQVSSFFEESTYTTLTPTLIEDILDVWILDSVERNRNLFHIHLLPFLILSQRKTPHTYCVAGAGLRCTLL